MGQSRLLYSFYFPRPFRLFATECREPIANRWPIQSKVIHRPQIPVPAALYDQGLVSTAEQMSKEPVPPIEPPCERPQPPLHSGHQIGLGGLDHRMKMVGHRTIGVHLPAGLLARLGQGFQKPPPILIIPEDRLPPVARFIT